MSALASAQAASSYLEKLRSKVPQLYERDDVLLSILQKNGDVEQVSPRSMRISLKIKPGGKGGQYSADGGSLGRGSGTTRIEALTSPIFFRMGFEVNKLVEYATNSAGKAVENIAKKEVKDGMAQFRAYLDKLLQTAGDGVLATISSGATTTTWVLAAPYGSALLYETQSVSVYDSTLATKRATEPEIVTISPDGVTITVDAAPAANANGDLLLPSGVSGANPVSMYGLKYHQSSASTGTWQNLNRATYPHIRSSRVNAASSALVTAHVRSALNKIRKLLGVNALQGVKMLAYMAVEQEQAWEQLGITISEITRQGSNQEMPDLLFAKSGTMGGVPIKTSINADPTRIDFLTMENWGRAVIQDIDMYEVGGRTVHPIYAADGGLAAAYLFYYHLGMQVFNQNPRMGAFIDSLTKPSLY
jgi:hypothetical protein